MPLFSKSQARPCSDGKTSTGRPKWPYAMTFSGPSSTCSRRMGIDHRCDQVGEGGVQGVAPGDVVMGVAHRTELDLVAQPAQRRGDLLVVGQVLLHQAAGYRDGDRPVVVGRL